MIQTFFKKRGGFTFTELMIVIAIMTVLLTVVFFNFKTVGSKQNLDKTTLTIFSVLNEAKSNSISSKDFSDHGVHLETNQITSFKGSTFTVGAPGNQVFTLLTNATISNISIGGSQDVVFRNVTGLTSASGTITISLTNDTTRHDVINIFSSGTMQITHF